MLRSNHSVCGNCAEENLARVTHGGPSQLPLPRGAVQAAAMTNLLRAAAPLAFIAATATAAPADTPSSSTAFDIVADLTTEIGARLDGSPREAAARDWAVTRLTALGFSYVHIEPFSITGFVPESAYPKSPSSQCFGDPSQASIWHDIGVETEHDTHHFKVRKR